MEREQQKNRDYSTNNKCIILYNWCQYSSSILFLSPQLENNALMLFKMQCAEVIKYGRIQNAYVHSDRQMQLKSLSGNVTHASGLKTKFLYLSFHIIITVLPCHICFYFLNLISKCSASQFCHRRVCDPKWDSFMAMWANYILYFILTNLKLKLRWKKAASN